MPSCTYTWHSFGFCSLLLLIPLLFFYSYVFGSHFFLFSLTFFFLFLFPSLFSFSSPSVVCSFISWYRARWPMNMCIPIYTHTCTYTDADIYTCATSGTLSVNVRDTVRYIFLQNCGRFLYKYRLMIHISNKISENFITIKLIDIKFMTK